MLLKSMNYSYKALIVEDSAADRVLYRRYLSQDRDYQYQFEEAVLGETGIELCQAMQPDFILLDYKLPDMDGLEFLAALSDTGGNLPCPVIVLTGQGDEMIATECMKLGVQDYQVKGKLTADSLRRSVYYSLQTYQMRRHLEDQRLLNTSILESISDAFLALDRELRFTYINREAVKLLGRSQQELLGKHFEQAESRLVEIIDLNSLEQILQEGKVQERESYSEARNAWFELHIFPTKEGLSVYLQDITVRKQSEEQLVRWNEELETRVAERTAQLTTEIAERKQVEKTLRQSEETYRLLARNLPESSVLIFNREIRYLVAEGGLLTRAGFKRELVEGRLLQEVLQPEDAARLLPYYQAALAGIENTFEEYYDDQVYLVRAVPILDDRNQTIAGMLFTENITALKQAQQILAAEKEQLSVTLRSIGDGVITVNLSGKVLILNRVAEALTGWTQSEASGHPIEDIFHIINEFTRQPQINPTENALKTGEQVVLQSDTSLVARDGTELSIADSCAPIRDQQSNIIGAVLVFRDVTEQNRIAKELQKTAKLEALGVLAGGIAHDFNNLLAGVIGYLELANIELGNEKPLEAPNTAQIADFIGNANKAALRAKDLTMQLLTFARGGHPVRKTANLNQVILEAAGFTLHGQNVAATFELPAQLWSVEVDSGQLSQVVQNLVLNAVQAMPGGGRLVFTGENLNLTKETVYPLAAGKYVRISIQDSGAGIPAENITKIFDPYYTTKAKGSGLGLAVCYSIIKKHEGYITVQSEVGKGTTFHIYLPASSNQAQTEQSPVAPSPGLTQQNTKYRVLVMDDEPTIGNLLKLILNKLGYQVELTKNGAEAVELYEASLEAGQPFDIVFLDLTVPGGMGGKQTLIRLLELNPQVKAVVCSGYSNDPIVSIYQEYGFWDVLTKPFRIRELGKVMERFNSEAIPKVV